MNVQTAQTATTDPVSTAPAHLRRIVLTGFMGAGKSTVGRLLADRIHWDFLDLDALIEDRAGITVPAIFATLGEPHFRRLESQALAAALSRDNIVLALGGGTPEILTNRLLLEQTPKTATVFLDAPFPVLYDRCMLQAVTSTASADPSEARPVLTDPTTAESRFKLRQPIYRRLALHTVDTASLTTEQAVSALLDQLNTSPPPRR